MDKLKTEGVKHDHGKPRFELLPSEPLEEIAKVLTFGAEKYTQRLPFVKGVEWIKNQVNGAKIILTDLPNGKGYAALVTKSISKKQIQSTQNDNVKIVEIGTDVIQNELQNICVDDRANQNTINVDATPISKQNTISQKMSGKRFWISKAADALSADVQNICIQITNTEQNSLEESYVVAATTDSAFLMTLYSVLKEHSLIYDDIQVTIKNNTVEIMGDWNWARGFKRSRLFGALLRHVFASLRGEDKDSESGLSHMAHAGCCVLFILFAERVGVGEDDRRHKQLEIK